MASGKGRGGSDGRLRCGHYLNSKFIKKQALQAEGPRRLVIQAVEETDGLKGRDGTSRKELQLVFADDTRFGLRAEQNKQRLIDTFGYRTSTWIGREIELYFSPDVPNPSGGEPGGIRNRFPPGAERPGAPRPAGDRVPIGLGGGRPGHGGHSVLGRPPYGGRFEQC